MTDAKKSNKELHREAYGAATTLLRQAHPDEFNRLRQAEAEKRGLEWKPKPTEEEKARETLSRILTDFPGLADTLTPDRDPLPKRSSTLEPPE